MKKITIIYVWGKKSEQDKYNNGSNISYAKIGQTNISIKSIDDLTLNVVKQKAIERCRQESRTGIPETARIFDLFIVPELSKKLDDIVRNILATYNFETSKLNNKQLDNDDIPAGEEFVYDINKINIGNAIKAFERDYYYKYANAEMLNDLIYCSKFNDYSIDETQEDNIKEANVSLKNRKPKFSFDLIGMNPGDKIYYNEKGVDSEYNGKEVEIVEGNKLKFNGIIYSSCTALVKQIVKRKNPAGTYAGPCYFVNKDGIRLNDLRNE